MEQLRESVSQLSDNSVSAASQLLNPEEVGESEGSKEGREGGREIADLYIAGNRQLQGSGG